MKHLFFSLMMMPVASWAHPADVLHSPWVEDTTAHHCEVVELPSNVFPQDMQKSFSPMLVPSISPSEDVTEPVFDNGNDYVYRLALCVSPAYIVDTWRGELEPARNWLKATGEYLNKVYSRDLGIRFEIVMDEKLFLKEYPEGYSESSFKYFSGTDILNKLIGKDAYDVGILIRPKGGGLAGQASLGGAYTTLHKGHAMATINETTIAHELGHMFGAKHTHVSEDALCIEPGEGQTIMSYGEPRTAFSLASALVIRRHLKAQKYYPNKDRNPNELVGGALSEYDNPPYVVPSERQKPKLDRSKIRKNYTVTVGTRFQFNIPVENPQPSFTYGAQGYDDAIFGFETNELQPVYDLTSKQTVMFQPYYDEGKNAEGVYDAIMVPSSDNFRVGRFTFMLAAADGPRYDVEKIRLNIVEGKPFQMKTKFDWQEFMGKDLKLEWEPCTELYGKDSKVRILLSDDFGQTFKYVIDDLVPNTGKWEGSWPFISIGRANYRNFSKPIRGGLIKIEVIGEAAYTVSKEIPDQANPTMLYSGGFELMDYRSYVRFKDGPTPYLKVKSEQDIPEMKELLAYHKNNGNTIKVQGTEERVQNVIRRKWRASVGGAIGTYSQLIIIEDQALTDRILLEDKAKDLKALAEDLFNHKGELAYPLPSVKGMAQLDAAYNAVFTTDGKVQADATLENITTLRSILDDICKAKDNEIVTPSDGHYYTLRNYQDIYGREAYYYLGKKLNPEAQNGFTSDAASALVWRCTANDGNFSFYDADGKSMELENFIVPGYNEIMNLDRGYTWGSFTLVNASKFCAQLSQKAKTFSRNTDYNIDRKGYRTNSDGTVSTDFQFVPVDFIEARKPGAQLPWNVLESKQQFTLDDTYSDLFVGKDVTIEQLQYTRQFHDTNWQTLYLPFDTKLSDWSQHCEVACLDEIQMPSQSAGSSASDAVATYVLVTEGTLKANQPYLIRAKETGTHTFILGKVTVKPTEENKSQLAAAGYDVHMNGNYGTPSAASLQKSNGYVLQGNKLQRADETMGNLASMRWYVTVNANGGGGTTLPENILLVEKGEKPIGTLSIETQEGYGTIYTEESYVMPQGVTGYYVTDVDIVTHEMVLSEVYHGGAIVPAGTPLLVKGEKRTYMLYAPKEAAATTNDEVQTQQNLLMGTATSTLTTAPNGQPSDAYYFYGLSYGDVNNAGTQPLGFYWAAPNGAAFTNGANKAYLAVEKQKADNLSGFVTPGNGTTGIETIAPVDEHLVVYTISGMRLYPQSLSQLQPGIYIVNGKKVVVK